MDRTKNAEAAYAAGLIDEGDVADLIGMTPAEFAAAKAAGRFEKSMPRPAAFHRGRPLFLSAQFHSLLDEVIP